MTVASAREDAGPVLAAVRALRRDHDPARARALLDAYMSAHPSGGLAEEALAISVEAAAANHDADANVLASRYLRLYPTGPFHAIAQRTLGATVVAPR
jgi:outer membrane protein assembly factor BamD (BamD/ComL family)